MFAILARISWVGWLVGWLVGLGWLVGWFPRFVHSEWMYLPDRACIALCHPFHNINWHSCTFLGHSSHSPQLPLDPPVHNYAQYECRNSLQMSLQFIGILFLQSTRSNTFCLSALLVLMAPPPPSPEFLVLSRFHWVHGWWREEWMDTWMHEWWTSEWVNEKNEWKREWLSAFRPILSIDPIHPSIHHPSIRWYCWMNEQQTDDGSRRHDDTN